MEVEAQQYDPVASKLVFEQAVKPLMMKMELDSTVVEENQNEARPRININKVKNFREESENSGRETSTGERITEELRREKISSWRKISGDGDGGDYDGSRDGKLGRGTIRQYTIV
ncbi:hypothetical protein NE237_013662 [Protea cynaroides]|uniref:Uncharacterized protein n=1 Tax=Protea cynaroides TaxID=273540 RepID=A0A9Q0H0C8_9MAGN|nr:hypothetical protein NE237_013662 [Protea cynaroides]